MNRLPQSRGLTVCLLLMLAGRGFARGDEFQIRGATASDGCVGVCAQLSSSEKNAFASYVNEMTVLDAMYSAESDTRLQRYAGKGLQLLGRVVGDIDLPTKGTPAAGMAVDALKSTLAWAVETTGEALESQSQEAVAIAIAMEIDQRVDKATIGDDRKINRDVLSRITDSQLSFIYSPQFRSRLGDPDILNGITAKVTGKQLSLILSDTGEIRGTVADMKIRLKTIDQAVSTLKDSQRILLEGAQRTSERLSGVEGALEQSHQIVESLAKNSISSSSILALYESGALVMDEKDVWALRDRVAGEKTKAELSRVGGQLSGVGNALAAIGLPEAGEAFNALGTALTQGGTLALAISTGDFFSGVQSVAGIVGSLSVLGRKRGPSAEMRMLRKVFEEIRQLSKKIDDYHQQEMEALARIDRRLIDLDKEVRGGFAEIRDDIWAVTRYVDELAIEKLTYCEALLPSYLRSAREGQFGGRVAFARWFENDSRNQQWAECIAGLHARLRVANETGLPMVVFAGAEPGDGSQPSFDDPKRPVRNLQTWILRPAVRYAQRYAGNSADADARRAGVFFPTLSVCEPLGITSDGLCEHREHGLWRESRVRRSNFNPGAGQLFSETRVLRMADFAKYLAPINSTVYEDYNKGGLPAVIAEADLGIRFGPAFMGGRTRHIEILMGAIDLLDVVIGQAQIIAGTTTIDLAAKELDEVVIPAYARARLLGDSQEIDELIELGHRTPDPVLGPRCDTGALGFDTLCLMQTNRWFRENVLRALLVRRLSARKITWKQWLSTARLPFSSPIARMLGDDVLLRDGSANLRGAVFARWAIELPRVNLRSTDSEAPAKDCWENTGTALPEKNPYAAQGSAFCALLPPISSSTADRMAFSFNIDGLVVERLRLQHLTEEYCSALSTYPSELCSWARTTASRADDTRLQ